GRASSAAVPTSASTTIRVRSAADPVRRSAARKPATAATRTVPTTTASGTSYRGRVARPPIPAATISAIPHVDLRSGSTRPATAQPARARVTALGRSTSGDTSITEWATRTSNGRVNGSPTVRTARAASAARRAAYTAGTIRTPPKGRRASARSDRGPAATTTIQSAETPSRRATVPVGALSSTGSTTV